MMVETTVRSLIYKAAHGRSHVHADDISPAAAQPLWQAEL